MRIMHPGLPGLGGEIYPHGVEAKSMRGCRRRSAPSEGPWASSAAMTCWRWAISWLVSPIVKHNLPSGRCMDRVQWVVNAFSYNGAGSCKKVAAGALSDL